MAAPNTRASMKMNGLIRGACDRRSRRGDGLIDRLRGTGRLDGDRQGRLNAAMANYEDAIRRGDDVAAAVADNTIDNLLDEARAEHQAASNGQTPTEPPAPVPSWDGGVRRPVRREPKPMTLGHAIAREMAAQEAVARRAREMTDDLARTAGRW